MRRRLSGWLSADDRAVSELIGYVLAFSVVVASIGVVYTAGLDSARQYQQHEIEQNAERAFVALAESLNDIQRGDAPARNGEVRLAGGTLWIDEGPRLTVTVADAGGGTVVYDDRVGAIAYSVGDTTVLYAAGAVIREQRRGGATVPARPRFRCTDRQAVVSFVTVTAGSASGRSSQGSVLIQADGRGTDLLYPFAGETASADSVSVTVGANADAWGRTLTERGWTRSGDSFTCTTDRVVVRRTTIVVDFL
ncbi:DUF7289 family protein [Halobaculum sp. D14]|uniref:DUF7289 family protein n=1 Tax=Halobaculum sp. D14 TaxID=3421642 RepID=UPI003EBBA74B